MTNRTKVKLRLAKSISGRQKSRKPETKQAKSSFKAEGSDDSDLGTQSDNITCTASESAGSRRNSASLHNSGVDSDLSFCDYELIHQTSN
jgi:hypothetical protein